MIIKTGTDLAAACLHVARNFTTLYEATGGLAPLKPFVPAPKPSPLPEIVTGLPLLKKGSHGQSVKALQILLKGYGYSLGSWGIDSSFGSATEAAVKLFQKACGLEDDGEVGPKTWAALLGV